MFHEQVHKSILNIQQKNLKFLFPRWMFFLLQFLCLVTILKKITAKKKTDRNENSQESAMCSEDKAQLIIKQPKYWLNKVIE